MTLRRFTASLVLAVSALVAAAPAASAHTELKSSNPAKGASVPTAPQRVELTFTEPVTLPTDAITVTGPEGAKWTVGQISVAGPVVTAPVQPTGPAGAYTLAYKVVAEDGDTVSGSVEFALATAATTTTTAPPTTTTTAPPSTSVAPAAQTGDGGGIRCGCGSLVWWCSQASVC